ncbi:MAG TPA: class I SAM-dependent methyltransferase [Candidatus Poseidoniales archaeon]|nr:class I SAM-dependent methyltransferase [Candidatus Poseidoniales archaeon]
MTQWDIEDITPALRDSPPDRRNQVWRDWYNHLISQLDNCDYRFMNYGYLGREGPELEPSDEADRIFIELYQVTLGGTDLTDKDVLDISSGLGGGAYWISRTCQPSSLVGMDLSPEAVGLCSKRYSDQHNLRFVVGDAESLPFPDNSFDVVYNIEASHCYTNFDVFLSEIFRVLRAGGVFCWSDFQSRTSMEKIESDFENSGLDIVSLNDITDGVLRSLDLVHKAISEDKLDSNQIIWSSDTDSLQDVIQEFAGGGRSYHCCNLSKKNSIGSKI